MSDDYARDKAQWSDDYARDIGRIIVAALGSPTPEKALVMLGLAVGTLVTMGCPLHEIVRHVLVMGARTIDRINSGEPSLLDEPEPGARK